MNEFLELYVSGFWIWIGLTTGFGLILKAIVQIIVGVTAALCGTPVHFGDINK